MTYEIEIAGLSYLVEINLDAAGGPPRCAINGTALNTEIRIVAPGVLSLLMDGASHRCILDSTTAVPYIQIDGTRHPFQLEDPRALRKRHRGAAGADGPRPLKASMPGRIVRIMAELDSEVLAQQPILAIEAMKMQNELRSPKAGRLARLLVTIGDTVQANQTLAIIE